MTEIRPLSVMTGDDPDWSDGIADSKRQGAGVRDPTDLKNEHHDCKNQCNRQFGIEPPWAASYVKSVIAKPNTVENSEI